MDEKILENLQILDKEDLITNLIVYCANNYRVNNYLLFGNDFLNFLGVKGKFKEIKSRVQVKGVGTPDMVLIYEDSNGKLKAVIIENKLKADEGRDQTENYSKGREKIKNKINAEITKFIFLTLFEDQKPKYEYSKDKPDGFRQETYKHFRKEVLCKHELKGVWKKLLDELSENLKEFYEYKVKDKDIIFENLKCDDDNLGKNYNYFKSIFNNIIENINKNRSDEKKFKYRRFRHMLLNNYDLSVEDQKTTLKRVINSWRGNLEQVDDILVMGIRFHKKK